jgi:hypothetical protein
MNINEIWKPTEDGKLIISNYGNVKKGIPIQYYEEKYIEQEYDSYNGYMVCGQPVDKMVATAFLPNPNNLYHVTHLDGDILNNKVENLKWRDNTVRSIFVISTKRLPKVNELIRSVQTGNFINLVISVSPLITDEYGKFVWITSVRYATTNRGTTIFLKGRRSRGFKWYTRPGQNYWEVVDEFRILEDAPEKIDHIQHIQKNGLDIYKPREKSNDN